MLRSSVTKFAAVPLTMAGMATLKADLTAAIRTFQRRHGLRVDGVIAPDGLTARGEK